MKKMERIKLIRFLTLIGTLLMTGCMPRVPAPELPKEENATKRMMWQDTSGLEDHYSLKPEPYSLESGENDPELLGPQSTIQRASPGSEMDETTTASAVTESFLPREEPVPVTESPDTETTVMTRSRCIDLIGQTKYDEYTKRYGSEAAALRKCTILQHVQK